MLEIDIDKGEAVAIRYLAHSLCGEYGSSDSEGLISELPQLSLRLPKRVRDAVMSYVAHPNSDYVLIRNHLISDTDLGPTPKTWKTPASIKTSIEYEMIAMLYASALGSVFGWATQQDGHLVNDVIPIELFADRQVGASSDVELAWHTEDAFHPARADYICLFCLRNPEMAPTTIASVGDILRDSLLPEALFLPCLHIVADDAQCAGASEVGSKNWTGPDLDAVPILSRTEGRIRNVHRSRVHVRMRRRRERAP